MNRVDNFGISGITLDQLLGNSVFCQNHHNNILSSLFKNMEHTLAMQIVGGVALLIGLKMNFDPVGFNKDIFGDVEGVDSNLMSASRMAIGGGILGLGLINLYCSLNVDDAAAKAILTGTAIGLSAFFLTIAGAKFRGYTDSIPTLPMIVLPSMVVLCLYSALI